MNLIRFINPRACSSKTLINFDIIQMVNKQLSPQLHEEFIRNPKFWSLTCEVNPGVFRANAFADNLRISIAMSCRSLRDSSHLPSIAASKFLVNG